MTQPKTRSRRASAPKPVRQVARVASLTLDKLAEAVVDRQPPPERPRDHAALLHWLGQSLRNAHPGAARGEVGRIMVARLREMADAGDATAEAVLRAEVEEFGLKLARVSLALAGALSVPDPPAVPKQQRQDAIAATVLKLTGWTSVDSETVGAIYRWLFGDEALFVLGTEMRVEAGLRMLENHDPRPVRVLHPDTGELVLVTREEIIEHAAADGRVLEAAHSYSGRQACWHSRLIRALEPYGNDSTSVGDALNRAAADLGIEPAGLGFEELAELVMAASEARAEAP
jgi:hypothetical protein